MAGDEQITTHHESNPAAAIWLAGGPTPGPVVVVDHDPAWPATFEQIAERLRTALGPAALAVEHVGSTAVPGLPAKPVVDVDLAVADPADEPAYRGALESAGFTLVVREPQWHEHRCFRGTDPTANVHVFGPGCPETIRHRMFRDWLHRHHTDAARYRDAKLAAAAATSAEIGTVMDYNRRKKPVIHAIYERMFRAAGLGTHIR
ncbi:GrpB family protein [Arthrobacter sp. JSM 101049]|uniref:GrpB family protein n=1 Tax=Arthrobacter sp. JSM 101049 TaxID=929097 RepID=UPI00356926AC